jgi:coenzyme Q-binding protein COQ10
MRYLAARRPLCRGHQADPVHRTFEQTSMPAIETTKVLPYRAERLFDLVLDMRSYPEFVPHCRDVRVLSHRVVPPSKTIIVSRMIVGFSLLHVGYTNRTIADADARRISVDAIDGPLRRLNAFWSFEPLEEEHTRVNFSVEYEFSSPLLTAVASQVFGSMFEQILNAFAQRAHARL